MSIELHGLTKRFGGRAAVDGVGLDIPDGAFCVVLGPSGCGKSTLLRLIAGLERADAGRVRLGGRDVTGLPPEDRGTAVVFQSYALWPHMDVAGNVGFPMRVAGLRGAALDRATRAHLDTVSLGDMADRRPADLSGGQRQRVALARCLASGARTVLMDEPLANLDPHLRHRMEGELAAFHRTSGATTLYITHDQREAMALADIVVVMQAGRFLQVGQPDEVHDRPACADVARFVGRGVVLDGVRRDGTLHVGPFRVRSGGPDGPVQVLIRPGDLRLGPGTEGGVTGRVVAATYRGGSHEVRLRAGAVEVEAVSRVRVRPGDTLGLTMGGAWVLANGHAGG